MPAREELLLRIYWQLEVDTTRADGYSAFHEAVRTVQEKLEREGITLGYRFEDRNLYGPWDRTLQQEIEALNLAGLVDNEDYPFEDGRRVNKHRLHLTRLGRDELEIQRYRKGEVDRHPKGDKIRRIIDEAVRSA